MQTSAASPSTRCRRCAAAGSWLVIQRNMPSLAMAEACMFLRWLTVSPAWLVERISAPTQSVSHSAARNARPMTGRRNRNIHLMSLRLSRAAACSRTDGLGGSPGAAGSSDAPDAAGAAETTLLRAGDATVLATTVLTDLAKEANAIAGLLIVNPRPTQDLQPSAPVISLNIGCYRTLGSVLIQRKLSIVPAHAPAFLRPITLV